MNISKMESILLDLGCGMRKKDGYIGIDHKEYDGVDIVLDLRKGELPFEDNSVEAIYASHFLEHLNFEEAIKMMNEVYSYIQTENMDNLLELIRNNEIW